MDSVQRLPGVWHIEYQYSIGAQTAAFFAALLESQIVGSKCSGCDRVYVPPKAYCEHCFVSIDGTLPVGLEGTIEGATVVTAAFAGSPDVPYCVAYVRLDGATSSLANFVRSVDLTTDGDPPSSIGIGRRVKVCFSDRPTGRITDFWFEPLVS